MIEIMGIKCLTEKEASKRYGYSRTWFRYRRWKKNSPPYVRHGSNRILYPIDEVDRWFQDRMVTFN